MAFNRSHSRYMRRGRFERLRHNRRLIDFLDTQATRLAASATGSVFAAKLAVATFTGDGVALASNETVTVGSKVYTAKTALSFAAATGTLTNDGSQPADTSTVVIGSKTYTFQTSLTNVDGNVKIGASNTASMTNLFHAINASGGTPGTDYATLTTAHPTVTATNPTGTTVVVTAITKGTGGNAIASTVGGTIHATWGGALLTGGVADVANEVLRASASATLTNLFHAINGTGGTAGTDYSLATVANADVVATNPSGTTVVVTGVNPGVAVATLATGTHGTWDVASVAGGSATSFTATTHGFTDFEGPYKHTTSGTLPTPLVTTKEYWVKVVDANTVKWATSREAAGLGIFVSISTNGSGTHTAKHAVNRQGIHDSMRRYSAEKILAATDIDSLN